MSDTIFGQPAATPATTPVVTPPTPVELPPEVVEFVGDGKKYASVSDALKSVPHAQKHIQTLEQELAQAREELTKRKTAEQLLEEMKAGQKPVEPTAPVAFDPDKVTQLVNQTLEQREAQRIASENVSIVTSSFTQKYGEKAEEIYNKVAQESGLSVQALNKLAATSPSAVLKLAGLVGQQASPAPGKPTGSVNTESLPTGKVDPSTLSARVPRGAKTGDLVNAWRVAGQKVGKST